MEQGEAASGDPEPSNDDNEGDVAVAKPAAKRGKAKAELSPQHAELARLQAELRELQGETPMVPLQVDGTVVAEIVSAWTGVPLGRMVKDEIRTVRTLGNLLVERVIGQDHALDAIAQRVRTATAKLEDPNKPRGVFMFVGPSGVGKTETALALADGSRHGRDAALPRRAGAAAPGAEPGDATGAWVQAIGGNGKLDGNSNTARTDTNSNGVLVGVDREFGGWQIGVLDCTGRTDVKQQERRARSKIDNTHFGAYASHNWGGFGLRGGVAWSRNEVKSNRDVAFAGFSDSLSARYNAHTRQAFIEAGYRFGSAEGGLEPYLQVARVEVDLKQIDERGGAAALHGKVDDTGTTVATAGVRFDKGLKASFQQDSWLHLRGGVGYRRASGDRSQVANLAFANSTTTFAVEGAPIADNAVVAELGLSAWLTPRQQLELGYSGQFGSESRDHGANARWSIRF
ncbi:hypothetical protein G6F68_010093 [Rhizopus microsporus]|nr:hypothetical protein G6F68_010093 [Rhizopus microsporus]